MISLTDLKEWLRVKSNTYDVPLTALEARAVAIVERELQWYFGAPRETTEYLNGSGTPKMFLRQHPDDGVVALSERSGVGGTWVALDADDYEVQGRGIYSAYNGVWYRGLRNYRAVYLEGFSAPPEDIQQVVFALVAGLWNRRGKDGFTSESIGDYSYTLGDITAVGIWPAVKESWKRGKI